TITVATITTLEVLGWRARSRNDDQLNVPIDTMIMTATSAAMGICFTQAPRNTTITSSTMPAVKVERRPRPPDLTLMTDCPIMAHPAMPPMKPEAMLATP